MSRRGDAEISSKEIAEKMSQCPSFMKYHSLVTVL